MYNLVNLTVNPSGILQAAMYWLLSLVLVVSVYYFYSQPLLLFPILIVLAVYGYQLHGQRFIYQRHRHWQIKNQTLYCVSHHQDSTSITQPEKVHVHHLQVWHSLVLFSYVFQGKSHQEIITLDAVDHAAFREFRCMMKQLSPDR